MLIFSFMMVNVSIAFMFFTNSPLAMALLLIASSLALSLAMGKLFSSWLTFSLILIFLGGMMVIFLYFCSLSSNEKPALKMKLWICVFIFMSMFFFESCKFSHSFLFLTFNFLKMNFFLNMLLIIYLLLCLLAVVKISENFKGALSLKFF